MQYDPLYVTPPGNQSFSWANFFNNAISLLVMCEGGLLPCWNNIKTFFNDSGHKKAWNHILVASRAYSFVKKKVSAAFRQWINPCGHFRYRASSARKTGQTLGETINSHEES